MSDRDAMFDRIIRASFPDEVGNLQLVNVSDLQDKLGSAYLIYKKSGIHNITFEITESPLGNMKTRFDIIGPKDVV